MLFTAEITFILTAAFTVWFLFKASANNGVLLSVSLLWMSILAVLAYFGFFRNNSSLPPNIVLAPAIPIATIALLFAVPSGRRFLNSLDLKTLTWVHFVRVPVEIVLYFLFTQNLIPELMTFEGNNPDIISGITAPMAVFMFFSKGKINRFGLLIWNILCLGLLVNIVLLAALSIPSPIQQFAFEQPNIAVLEFPFIWLPGIVVPLVFFAHVASIYLLVKKSK